MTKDKIQTKAQKMLKEMSIQQKLAQVIGMFGGGSVPSQMFHRFSNGLGEIAVVPGSREREENLALAEEEQAILQNHSGIPAIRHNEALTGQMTADSTIFPSAIGLAATWQPDIVERMADLIRRQMVAVGTRQALSPVMDVARDPRWGRVGETYGEDPTLCASMSVAFTRGLQSENLKDGVIATGKHFLGYSMSEGGLNMAANPIPPRELREVYAKPFQAAITEAGLGSVMNSYGVIDGEQIIGSRNILTKLLREEMGFDGLVVSDYMSINKLVELKNSASPEQAGLKALKAGMEMELPMPYGYIDALIPLIENDQEAQEALDTAVLHVLEAKIKLDLDANPAGRRDWIPDAYDRTKAEPLSLEAARASIVLLENNGILPLKKEPAKIALIGPHANSIRLLFGCYTYPAAFDRDFTGAMSDMPGMSGVSQNKDANPNQMPHLPGSRVRANSPIVEAELSKHYEGITPTIWEAICTKCPQAEVRYAKGCDFAGNDISGFDEAEELARWGDVVILVGGGKYGWGTGCTTGEGIDCDRLTMPGVQEELARRVAAIGKPRIFVHMDTKPLASSFIVQNYDAVLEAWFPGDTGGKALADVLFGDYNPAGRLPITAVRSVGQIPIYASQRNGSGRRDDGGMVIASYAEGTKEPLYCFGFGRSYTTFAYSNLTVTPVISAQEQIEVSCTVTNTGNRYGEEVVQLYVTDELASMIRPAQELAGFCRVALDVNESKEVHFRMKASQFAFLDEKMDWLVEAGTMTVQIGSSSDDFCLHGSFEISDSAIIDGKTRGFFAEAWAE